ncbi:restriction endonuclease subunit S [Fructilactobacillus sanfranciscensis]|uniref:restriction endonuclease subunit S n=1 Tax=Fructilactobacillus sanfranciscensis TaxID=1625 RepID=UPI00111AB545|nr:restriction endonuclease subunit S [Fructilactobacillus sanfranciscensis]MVF15820.1 restriction endonuclease subunit S [Fructilactobacillus sanfranciscensis]TNL00339.1 restriction endonuclease subunit S [Fructilactobacillus sanfranciscensis]
MKNKKMTPRIRFSGFADDWEDRKLSDIADRFDNLRVPITASNRKPGDTPYYGANGIQDYVEGFTHNGEFILVAEDGANDLKNYPVQYVNGKAWVNNHAHVLQGKKTITDNKFLMNAIKNFNIEPFLVGGGRAKLNADVMMKLNILLPTFVEQEKIGSFFKQLDNTIDLHQRKLDLLKEQKKGYLQKMFPKNGAKVPELRFAGFADDWEEHKLGDVIDIENGYAFKSEYFSDEEKRHIVLTPGSVKIGGGFQKDKGRYYDVSGVFPEKFIFKPGNIFITMTDLTPTAQSLGYPAIVPRDDNIYLHNQRLGKIINTTTNPEFLYTLLTTDTYHKEIVSSASGTTVKHSSVSKILDFKSAIPNIDEQKLIGSFFKELDNTIVLHQRKLDLLKEQKKGFLQNMFV